MTIENTIKWWLIKSSKLFLRRLSSWGSFVKYVGNAIFGLF